MTSSQPSVRYIPLRKETQRVQETANVRFLTAAPAGTSTSFHGSITCTVAYEGRTRSSLSVVRLPMSL